MKIKNLFLISATVCILSCLINVVSAIDCLSKKEVAVGIIYIILAIVGIACVVAFVFYSRRNASYLFSHLKYIKIFSIIALFCTMLGGLVAVYTYYTLVANIGMQQRDQYARKEIDGVEIIDDARMAKYIDDINRLEELKKNDIISNAEYERLKRQIANEYLKGE